MKRLSMFLLLVPAFLLSQEQTTKRDTTLNTEKAVNNQVVFTNDGKLKFPDNTVQETAYPGNSQSQGNPPNFDILNNGIQFPDGTVQTTAYIPGNNPPTLPVGLYIQFSQDVDVYGNVPGFENERILNIDAYLGGVNKPINVSSPGGGEPEHLEISINGILSDNAPLFKDLIAKSTPIQEIEIFLLKIVSGVPDPVKVYSYKYKNVYLNGYNENFSDVNTPNSSVSFVFSEACYCSRIYNNGSIVKTVNSCWDVLRQTPCSCSCSF